MSFFECANAGRIFAWRDRLIVDATEHLWVLHERDVVAGGAFRQLLGHRAVPLDTPPDTRWSLTVTDGKAVWVDGANANFHDLETGERRVLPIREFVRAREPSTRDPKWTGLERAIPLPFAPGLVYERGRAVHNLYLANDLVWGDGATGAAVADAGVTLRGSTYYGVDAANKALFAADTWDGVVWRLSDPGQPALAWFGHRPPKGETTNLEISNLSVGTRGHIAVAYAEEGTADEPQHRVHVGRTTTPTFQSVGSVPCTSMLRELWLGWSPDGKTLAVVEAAGARTSIRLLDPDARVRAALRVRGVLQGAAWASNGKALYVADATGIHVVKV